MEAEAEAAKVEETNGDSTNGHHTNGDSTNGDSTNGHSNGDSNGHANGEEKEEANENGDCEEDKAAKRKAEDEPDVIAVSAEKVAKLKEAQEEASTTEETPEAETTA